MRFAALAAILALSAAPAAAQEIVTSEKARFRIVRVASGLDHPWSLAFLPDGRMLVTERPGRLRVVSAEGRLQPNPVRGVPEVSARNQGGLFDVVPHPRFSENGLLFLSYAAPADGGSLTRVARARLAGDALVDLRPIFDSAPASTTVMHYGGRLAIGADGTLHLTTGDRRDDMRAQRPGDLNGKLIRIDADGRAPADNPFLARAGWRPEIWAYGLRNSQGLAFDASGMLWSVDHGAQGGDELNLLLPGRDYGWPVVTHSRNYGIGTPIGEATSRPGVEDGRLLWTPSIAPSGLAFHSGPAFPGWNGSAFVGALAGRALHRIEIESGRAVREEKLLAGIGRRIRDVRVDAAGRVLLLTDEADGLLLRLEPTSP